MDEAGQKSNRARGRKRDVCLTVLQVLGGEERSGREQQSAARTNLGRRNVPWGGRFLASDELELTARRWRLWRLSSAMGQDEPGRMGRLGGALVQARVY